MVTSARSRVHPRPIAVFGCPRSGTTALAQLLTANPKVFVGMERYKSLFRRAAKRRRYGEVGPELFGPERFLDFRPTDGTIRPPRFGAYYAAAARRFEAGSVRYLGDKVMPVDVGVLSALAARVEDIRFVFIYRDLSRVAASFCARAADPRDSWPASNTEGKAIELWHESFTAFDNVSAIVGADRVHPVRYETLFSGDEQALDALVRFLGVPPSPSQQEAFRRRTADWPARLASPVRLTADQLARVDAVDRSRADALDRQVAELLSR